MKTASEVLKNHRAFEIQNFHVETLRIESSSLKDNPLNDPHIRFNPLLVPRTQGPWPVVLILSGFTGNSPFYFNAKFNEQNAVQVIDQCCSRGEAPEALYVFVDALTTWGGSQFLNSPAMGRYEDYIMQDLIPSLQAHYSVSAKPENWCVTGGSSGGYGALHLATKYPETFGYIGAIAPDSFFEVSLLPELYAALPLWEKFNHSGLRALEELRNGKLVKLRNWHTVINAFGMAACYGAKGDHGDFELPINSRTGLKNETLWRKWLEKDPLHFLPERLPALKKIAGIYLDVGNKDNFHLQYGCRQISDFLKSHQIGHDYVEFDGNHFDIGERRPEVWRWLATVWR